ncbi:MAG: SurA N-terminal domain-containing protein [Sphingomonas bacterium]|nr:SurA N-terminal domain-containing protein [Sphingomonas bacterium]
MLSSFRRLTKSKVGTALLVLFLLAIVASFALADMSSIGGNAFGAGGGNLAKAGDERVSERDYSTAMERILSNARQQNPEATYASLAKETASVLDQLIDDAALKAFGSDHELVVSRKLVDGEITSLPSTRGLDGKFSEQAYAQFLAQQRLSDVQVRRLLEADLVRRVLLSPVAANATVPVGVATQYASMLLEQRQGELVLVLTEPFAAGLAPTAGDLQAYYDQNRQRYMVPEQRVLRIASIGPEQVAAVAPTEQDIAAYYTANRASYAGKEVRIISQAVVAAKPAADAIAARARSGASFVAAAAPAGLSAEDISVGPQTRAQFTSLAGDKVAAATFAAATGAIVGPVQSDLGWHVIRIDQVRGEAGRSLTDARAEIITKLTAEKRKEALVDMVTRIEDSIGDGASLAEAAASAKVALVDTPLISGAGTDRANPAYRLPDALAPALKSGFELTLDDDPVVETLPNDSGYLLVGVGRIVPASPAPLAQIKPQVAADWTRKKASDRARAVASQIAAQTARGVAMAEAARQGGKGVSPVQPFGARRIQLSKAPADIAAPLRILFSLAQGKSRMVADPQGRGFFVVRAVSITAGNASTQPALIGQVQASFRDSVSQELARQFVAAVRADVGVARNEKAIAAAKARLNGSN